MSRLLFCGLVHDDAVTRLGTRSRFIILLIVCGVLWLSVAHAEDKPQRYFVVAGLQNENSDLPETELKRLGDVARDACGKDRFGFVQMDNREFNKKTKRSGPNYQKCVGSSCLIDLGRQIGAEIVVTGNVFQSSDGYRVVLALYATKDSRHLKTMALVGANRDGLESALKEKMAELFTPLANLMAGDAKTGPADVEAAAGVPEIDVGRDIVNKVSSRKGLLVVDTTPPNATILINGVERGTSPFRDNIMVGKYVVVARLANYEAARQELQITQNGETVRMTLQPEHGTLKVESVPTKLDVLIDNRPVGKTPFVDEELQAGRHRVEVRSGQLPNESRMVDVSAGKVVTEVFDLSASESPGAVSDKPRLSPWPWVTFGVGAAAILTGGLLNVFADKDLDSASGPRVTQAEAAAYAADSNAKNNAAIGMYSVGGAAVVAGLIWGVLDSLKVRAARDKAATHPTVSGMLMPGGGGIGLAGTF